MQVRSRNGTTPALFGSWRIILVCAASATWPLVRVTKLIKILLDDPTRQAIDTRRQTLGAYLLGMCGPARNVASIETDIVAVAGEQIYTARYQEKLRSAIIVLNLTRRGQTARN